MDDASFKIEKFREEKEVLIFLKKEKSRSRVSGESLGICEKKKWEDEN